MDVLLIAVITSPSTVSIQVCGEVDLSNRDQLQAALSAVDFDGARTDRLDLQHLTFCDISGCWHLLLFEREARPSGHQTSIHGARPTVRKVLSLMADGDKPTFA
jgi:anti-anti-sigma regulatory factor